MEGYKMKLITVMQILFPDCSTNIFMMITLSIFTSYACDHTSSLINLPVSSALVTGVTAGS